MKTFLQVSVILLALMNVWAACKKECIEDPPDVPATEELIAFLDGRSETLYIVPEKVEQVLQLYGAQPANNTNSWFLVARTPQGEDLPMMVHVTTAPAGEIIEIADNAAQDGTKPNKPESKVHTNSICSKEVTKAAVKCAQKKFDDGTEYFEDTSYSGEKGNITYNQCRKGGDKDCIEWKVIIGYTRQYKSTGCAGLPFASTALTDWVCTK